MSLHRPLVIRKAISNHSAWVGEVRQSSQYDAAGTSLSNSRLIYHLKR